MCSGLCVLAAAWRWWMNISVDLLLQLENALVGMRSALQKQPSLAGNGELVEDTGTVAQHHQLDLMRDDEAFVAAPHAHHRWATWWRSRLIWYVRLPRWRYVMINLRAGHKDEPAHRQLTHLFYWLFKPQCLTFCFWTDFLWSTLPVVDLLSRLRPSKPTCFLCLLLTWIWSLILDLLSLWI